MTEKKPIVPGCRVRVTWLESAWINHTGVVVNSDTRIEPHYYEVKMDDHGIYRFQGHEIKALSWPRERPEDQALPIPNDEIGSHDVAIKMLQERKELGLKRYGSLLQPNNGRDNLQDAIEELIDLLVYLVTEKRERNATGEKA